MTISQSIDITAIHLEALRGYDFLLRRIAFVDVDLASDP
jgi:hypothetical protein